MAYAASNLFRIGTFNEIGSCSTSADRDDKDDTFFMFNPSIKGISRKALLNAHKRMASYIVENLEAKPTEFLSPAEWDKIAIIFREIPEGTKPRSLYRNLHLAPFIERIVNKKFMQQFADYDDFSLRALMSQYLLDDTLKSTIFPQGIEFTREELAIAQRIKLTLVSKAPDHRIEFRKNSEIKEIVEAKIAALRLR